VKAFEDGFDLVQRAVDAFDRDVKNGTFPTDAESYQ
jgi:ketopantoate hydroxymethyltransferase